MDLTYSRTLSKAGYGRCKSHHGEILQGAFADADGQLRRGLVTLPTSEYGSQAFFLADARAGIVIHHPHDKAKAKEAARRALVALGKAAYGGDLFIASNCPIGWGLGSSTADVVATLRAVADAYGTAFDPTELARLAVLSETASDSIMFDDSAVLFAQRDGFVLEAFDGLLPSFLLVSINTSPSGLAVDTLRQPLPCYSDEELYAFVSLRKQLCTAIREGCRARVAAVATASARINNRYCPKPHLEEIIDIALTHGGLGVQVAHSGSLAGLLFDPDKQGVALDASKAVNALRRFNFSHLRLLNDVS